MLLRVSIIAKDWNIAPDEPPGNIFTELGPGLDLVVLLLFQRLIMMQLDDALGIGSP